MRPPASVAGTRWDAVDAALELQLGEHALALDRGDRFLEPARFGGRGRDQLDLPPHPIGIFLVHAEQVAGEQRRLVAAGAGADLEHRRALVGGVAREQRQRQRTLGGFERSGVAMELLGRHLAQLVVGIVRHRLERHRLGAQLAHLAGGDGDGLELGIFLRDRDEAIRRQVAGRHHRLQLVAPRLDRGDAVGGDDHCAVTVE